MQSSREQKGEIKFNEQCKEIEENNRKGKTRALQEHWEYQRNILTKYGHNIGQNGEELIEAEIIKKRWKEYPEELYKKDLNDPGR